MKYEKTRAFSTQRVTDVKINTKHDFEEKTKGRKRKKQKQKFRSGWWKVLFKLDKNQKILYTMVKTFRAYLPTSAYRKYSCVHCRAHLASHDDLISKVRQSLKNSTLLIALGDFFFPVRIIVYSLYLVISRQPRTCLFIQFSVSNYLFKFFIC